MSRLVRRRALLIGIANYDDGRFGRLPSAHVDIWQLRQVLEDRGIGAFTSVRPVTDLTADDMRSEIAAFLGDCGTDELATLYVSGHGTRLIQAGGEFYFVAKDTDFDRVAETGVSAGFVNDRLEECWAPQKVLMIDCCRSGGFAGGFRTTDRPAGVTKSGEKAPLTSRGVYVLSSSRAGEDSLAGAESAAGVEPSVFTGEVVEALRTGKVGKDGTGEVSVGDLFDYVCRRMRVNGSQVPVTSAHGVDDRMIIANCPQGRVPILKPFGGSLPVGPTAATPMGKAATFRAQPTWKSLIGYYEECVRSDEAETPLMEVSADGTSYVCLGGSERFLSGDIAEDQWVALPPEAVDLVASAAKASADLWAGYPAVVIEGPREGKPWRTPRFAPLLVRQVEVVDHDGETRLRPYGPVLPHPRLAQDWLGAEQAAALIDSYQPTWHAGQHDRMAVDVRHLLQEEYELPCVQVPRPDQLADRIDIRTPGSGARNAAVLYLAPRNIKYTKNLLKDLEYIAKNNSKVSGRALAALSPDPSERAAALAMLDSTRVRVVTPLPCNETQEVVLRSAMTRRLTVATGPPGTGKSQLVANLVATAVANHQSVLVASTNNQAVDEVWQRCEGLTPSGVIRTGSAGGDIDYTEAEGAGLRALLAAPAPERETATVEVELDIAHDRLTEVRANLARVAHTERVLRLVGAAREEHAARLHISVSDLLGRFVTGRFGRVARKATRAAHARLFGEARRRRLLRRYGVVSHEGESVDACGALADFARAEQVWRAEKQRAEAAGDDASLTAALDGAEADVRTRSAVLFDNVVRSNARYGKPRIMELLRARDGDDGDWYAVAAAIPAARGWAVSSLSARRFPLKEPLFDLVIVDEASQCAVPHVVPLLFRAKRALIIGDPMQLSHISKIGAEREKVIRRAVGLRSDWLDSRRLAYRRYSAFHAAERAAGESMLLDEHYRCHPNIVDISNRLFYDGQLTVLTDGRGRPTLARDAVIWADVSGNAMRPSVGGSWVNADEIDKVVASVLHLLAQLPVETGATFGVCTPFKAQEQALRARLRGYEDRVRIGTVHTFQGGERDVMILSLVAGKGMNPGAISWVDRELNIWNVAITRARSHLIVVGDRDLWRKRGGIGAALVAAAETPDGGSVGRREVDELLRRLYDRFAARSGNTVELGGSTHGHRCDAVVRTGEAPTIPYLLDRGAEEGADEARHLRLMLRRRELFDGLGEQPTAVRLPGWKLYDSSSSEE